MTLKNRQWLGRRHQTHGEKWVCVCQRKLKRSRRCLVCVREILTVRSRQNTAYTCCAAELRLAAGKQTSWDARLQDLGSTRSTRTACQSIPCLLHSWKEHTREEKHAVVNMISPKCTMEDFLYKKKKKLISHKQRPLLCILPQHCSWKWIPHLSPPPLLLLRYLQFVFANDRSHDHVPCTLSATNHC